VSGSREIDNSLNWMAQARTRLALRRAEKPATKAGQIRALWPDIEAALAVGQTIKSICKWLEEDAGITCQWRRKRVPEWRRSGARPG